MSKPISVLIVEGELAEAELMLRELRQAGFESTARVVQSEKDYLAALTPAPDLILADHNLPQFDGTRALALLQERQLDVPFIMVSGSVGEEQAVAVMRDGAADYVFRGRLSQLGQAAHRAIETKRLRDERERVDQELRKTERLVSNVLDNAAEAIVSVDTRHRIVLFNKAAEKMFGYSRVELLGQPLDSLLPASLVESHRQQVTEFAASHDQTRPMSARSTLVARRKDGSEFPVEISLSKVVEQGQEIFSAMVSDISERKRTEQDLATALDYVQTVVEKSTIGIITYRANGDAVTANSAAAQIVGGTVEKLQAQNFRRVNSWKVSGLLAAAEEALASNTARQIDVHFTSTFGKQVSIACRLAPFQYQGEQRLLALFTDIQHRARSEQELRRRAEEFAALYDTARDLSVQTELPPLLKTIVDRATALLRATSGTLMLYDPTTTELELVAVNKFPCELGVRRKMGEGAAGRVAVSREPLILDDYSKFDGRVPQFEGIAYRASLQVPMLFGGTLMGVLAVHEIDSDRKYNDEDAQLLMLLASQAASAVNNARLFEETQRHLRHVQALHQIDIAIGASVDLRTSLGVFLDHATSELAVDAASILLLNEHSQVLEFAARRGFRTPALQYTNLRLGDGLAGKAALSQRTVVITDLIRDIDGLTRSPFIQHEGFLSYFGVPLMAKGKVNGVLEIFHRARLEPDKEWLEFLETLAGQAAIAIDNAQLHNSLQRANIELSLAYDSTLEGWSAALDLRDRETEGHTRRVTEMSLRLARELGMKESDLVHVRRGALLHDIGKMGIPDSILFKPGPLTEDEWHVMHQHPEYAFQLLSSISFLKQALDIPYCHHEKWDGSGYPRGLKGEQIPLAARIFAVADVWDALLSNRPYRQAWQKADVIKHVHSLAGSHFDPHIAQVFLRMVD